VILAPGPAIRRADCRVQQFQLVFRLRHRRCRPSVPAQIKANWEAFFSGATSAAKKIVLLQNGLLAFITLRPRPAAGILTFPLRSSDREDGHSRRVPAAGDDQNS
jgi:hypothetical protein